MRAELSLELVEDLGKTRSPESRARVPALLHDAFRNDRLSDAEREIAQDIITILANDSVQLVRAALARQLSHYEGLPRSVAFQLARDVDEIAAPILQHSPALVDEDLLALVVESSLPKLVAIARRRGLSDGIAEALIDSGESEVVAAVANNHNASLGLGVLRKLVRRFGAFEEMQVALIERPQLPVEVVESLVVKVSDALREQLVKRHAVSDDLAEELLLRSRDHAVLDLAHHADPLEVYQLAKSMHARERLTPTAVLLSLCMGDETFFLCAMAVRARRPIENTRLLLADNAGGFAKVYELAGLPAELLDTFSGAYAVARKHRFGRSRDQRRKMVRQLLDQVIANNDALSMADIALITQRLRRDPVTDWALCA